MLGLVPRSAHTVHIPVMGTGYTVDTPLRVAKYGISSVISLVDDVMIEQVRRFHCQQCGEPYEPISAGTPDVRATRITAYLNLLDALIGRQIDELKASPFVPGSEITKYFELLPDDCEPKRLYAEMLAAVAPAEKASRQEQLRQLVAPGRIDVNIMVASDLRITPGAVEGEPGSTDAAAALRGFASSRVRSALVLSAGMSPRLYAYAAQFPDFFPDADGQVRKQIILKVSDYRSAVIQGKYLAKYGVWVSEFRVESGLNCGGHVFPTQGQLLGPILDVFRQNHATLRAELWALCSKSLRKAGRIAPDAPPEMRITAQGGIGTAAEDRFLLMHYELDGTGWATPFLMVPEATNVDDEHLARLLAATEKDVFLSSSSPMDYAFWNLRNSGSENARRRRIEEGCPGAPCPKGYCKLFNTEFTKIAICLASREYQKQKLATSEVESSPPLRERVLAKSCICNDLAGGALRKLGIDPQANPAICPGPGALDFSQLSTLQEMVDHIYGRTNRMTNRSRPNMFLRELALYIDWLTRKCPELAPADELDKADVFRANLFEGIAYYRQLAEHLGKDEQIPFLAELSRLEELLKQSPHGTHAAGA